jgi:hypothetical protein
MHLPGWNGSQKVVSHGQLNGPNVGPEGPPFLKVQVIGISGGPGLSVYGIDIVPTWFW